VSKVAKEELAHVSVGLYWFLKVCQMMGRVPGDTFRGLIGSLFFIKYNNMKLC
jgi:uncharacterized ferritin-like protein (DUF455 family)